MSELPLQTPMILVAHCCSQRHIELQGKETEWCSVDPVDQDPGVHEDAIPTPIPFLLPYSSLIRITEMADLLGQRRFDQKGREEKFPYLE